MAALHELGAADTLALLRRGELSSEELVRALLQRIHALDGSIGAFEHCDPELALEAARRVDALAERPPLAGLPFAVKDIIDTADLPTECGLSAFRGRRPADDAAIVARLRRAGGVVLGKSVTTELAFFKPGATRNPHDPRRTPGGSSSGSAAAVAAHLAPAALGTQTAGSIIRPAVYCGVVGFKPTYGLLPIGGVAPFAPSLDTLGLFARSVADVAEVAATIAPGSIAAGREDRGRAPRLALCRTTLWPLAEPSTRELVERSVSHLGQAGARTREIDLAPAFAGLADAQRAIMAAEAGRTLGEIVRDHRDVLSPVLLEFVAEGERVTAEREAAARAQAAACRTALAEIFEDLDALVTPAAVGEAPLGLESTGDPAFNRIWTLLGAPCVAIPAGQGPNGMPLAIQLVGAPARDTELLASAAWVESALSAWR